MNRRNFIAFLIAAPVTRTLPWPRIAKVIAPIAPQTSAAIALSLTEIINATIRARAPQMLANIQANNALLRRIQARG